MVIILIMIIIIIIIIIIILAGPRPGWLPALANWPAGQWLA